MSNLINKTIRETDALRGGVETYTHTANPNAPPAQQAASYPRRGLDAESPKDELMREKREFMQKAGGPNTSLGTIVATDSDFEWLRKKRETEQFANFDAWIGKNFNTDDVATRQWLQQTYPKYYDDREQMMVDRAKQALRIHLIKLRGPKTEEDMIMMWGLQTGRIKLDAGWDKIGPAGPTTMTEQRTRFAEGLMAPKRYLSDKERENAAAVAGNPFVGRGTVAEKRAAGQMPSPFSTGNAVPDANRYPSFLENVLKNI